jgi:hypothetical protein
MSSSGVVRELLLLPLQRLDSLLHHLCDSAAEMLIDSNASLLCEALTSSDSLSSRSCSLFLSAFVCPVVRGLNAPASRLLFYNLQALAKIQPNAISTSLLCPVVQDPEYGHILLKVLSTNWLSQNGILSDRIDESPSEALF